MQPLDSNGSAELALSALSRMTGVLAVHSSDGSDGSSSISSHADNFAQACLKVPSVSPDQGNVGAADSVGENLQSSAQDDTSLDDNCNCESQCLQCFSGCKKRVKGHSRGQVCKLHHDYISCAGSCGNRVHVGCVVLTNSGQSMLPNRDIPWLCAQCTPVSMQDEVGVNDDVDTAEPPKKTKSYKTKTFFETRQALCHHMRLNKWTCASGGEKPWLYFRCAFLDGLGQPKCSVKVSAIARDANELDGEWSVKDLPTSHDCVAAKCQSSTLLTTHGKSLSCEVFKDIQRLACSKSFHTASIQRFIQTTHNTLVDTKLIYNIGYRARSKLGLDEMDKLYQQKKVYTPSLSICIINPTPMQVYTPSQHKHNEPNTIAGTRSTWRRV